MVAMFLVLRHLRHHACAMSKESSKTQYGIVSFGHHCVLVQQKSHNSFISQNTHTHTHIMSTYCGAVLIAVQAAPKNRLPTSTLLQQVQSLEKLSFAVKAACSGCLCWKFMLFIRESLGCRSTTSVMSWNSRPPLEDTTPQPYLKNMVANTMCCPSALT